MLSFTVLISFALNEFYLFIAGSKCMILYNDAVWNRGDTLTIQIFLEQRCTGLKKTTILRIYDEANLIKC